MNTHQKSILLFRDCYCIIRTCSSTWRMPRIELNGEGEPVWLTPHLRDPQPEGERDCIITSVTLIRVFHNLHLLSPRLNVCIYDFMS